MGQDKQQLNHLLSFVKTIYDDPDNKEFAAGIQSMIKKDLQRDKNSWSGKIDEIYEYCLNKNLREQAEDLYKNFPLTSIRTSLIEDYVRMEESRRKNDFDYFGLHLYQQIESIINTLAKDSTLSAVVKNMISQPADINLIDHTEVLNGKQTTIYKKIEDYSPADRAKKGQSIADFVLIKPKSDGTPEGEKKAKSAFEEKKSKALSQQVAIDKMYLILYFICYRAMMYNNIKDGWNKNKQVFSTIYNVRNHVHREGESSDYQKAVYENARANTSQSYLRFLSALVFLVEGVEKGYPISQELVDYAGSTK